MNDTESFKLSIGVIAAMMQQRETLDGEAWRQALDVLFRDMKQSELFDMNMTMAGIIIGLINTVCEQAPAFSDTTPAEYLALLGKVVAEDEDEAQGKLDLGDE